MLWVESCLLVSGTLLKSVDPITFSFRLLFSIFFTILTEHKSVSNHDFTNDNFWNTISLSSRGKKVTIPCEYIIVLFFLQSLSTLGTKKNAALNDFISGLTSLCTLKVSAGTINLQISCDAFDALLHLHDPSMSARWFPESLYFVFWDTRLASFFLLSFSTHTTDEGRSIRPKSASKMYNNKIRWLMYKFYNFFRSTMQLCYKLQRNCLGLLQNIWHILKD